MIKLPLMIQALHYYFKKCFIMTLQQTLDLRLVLKTLNEQNLLKISKY